MEFMVAMCVCVISAIVESLAGFESRTTDSVNVNHISLLYNMLVETLQATDFENIDFAREVCGR